MKEMGFMANVWKKVFGSLASCSLARPVTVFQVKEGGPHIGIRCCGRMIRSSTGHGP